MAKKAKQAKKIKTPPASAPIGRLGPANPLLLRGGTHEALPHKGDRATNERRAIDEQLDDAR